MGFKQALRDATWILLTEGRASTARLMHELDLGPEQLAALLGEIVGVKGWAIVDKDGVVTWVGNGTRGALATAAPVQTPAHESEPVEAATEAERRQLTVLFCDLAGSTVLATELDPEDMNELIADYQNAVQPILKRFDGFLAKFMGDGILAYFGYPKAREKDPQRAILAALAIVEAIREIDARRPQSVAVRIGIATGTVLVGELIGEGSAQERSVVGDAPNLAARLQALAPQNGVVISDVTRELSGDGFEIVDLGERDLKGFAGRTKVWQVVREREADFSVEAGEAGEAAPLVGRQEELGLLVRAWQQSRQGSGQVVTVSGEAGIGKSRLVEAVIAACARDGALRVTFRCTPHHSNSPLFPIISRLKRTLGLRTEDNNAERLTKLEKALTSYQFANSETVSLLAALMSVPLPADRYPPLNLSLHQQRLNTLDMLLAWLLEEAERQPMIIVWEDLHWSDPSTLELIAMMIEQCPTAPILNVATFRPDFAPGWPVRSHVVPITLNRLERPEVESLIRRATRGKSLPPQVIEHIVRRGDGVPLYVGELTSAILASSALKETPDGFELTGPLENLSIPATLQDSLLARLDKAPLLREVAQLGAVLGREFSYEMVEAIGAFGSEQLQDGLGRLVAEDLLYQRGRLPRARYMFKHALIQDAAYQSLLKRLRQRYHASVAQILIDRYPEIAETQPETLAHHYTEAGDVEAALAQWLRAGQQALARSANHEAIGHLRKGLSMLPGGGRYADRELALLRPLGAAYMATRGYGAPETIETFDRARKLCGIIDDDSIFPVLFGLWLTTLVQAEHAKSLELAAEMQALVGNARDPYAVLAADAIWGFTYIHTGDQESARRHLRKVAELSGGFDTATKNEKAILYGLDVELAACAYSAWTEWLLGYPDAALDRQRLALRTMETSTQSYSRVRGSYWCAVVSELRGDWRSVIELTDGAIATARAHGMSMVEGVCRILNVSARACLGEGGSADEIAQAIEAYMATGGRFQTPYHRTLQSRLLLMERRIDEGFAILAGARDMIDRTGEAYFLSEVVRLRGEMLLAGGGERDDAEACFRHALEIAGGQKAKSLELRAATSLAQSLVARGHGEQAKAVLSPVLTWFTEGFGTHDLKAAQAVLEQL
jgi:class 3 adenylate cyclase/tetratricopeptide (TPR) repeat protein